MTEFITRNYGNKEYEIIIKTDSKEHYEATEEFARRLIDQAKPQTNADRMIQMIQDRNAGGLIAMWEEIFEDGVPSDDYMRWWLKQPAEVE